MSAKVEHATVTVALPLLSSVMVKAAAVVSGWAGSDHGNCFENHDATVIAPPSASHVLLSRASGLLVEELLPMLLAQVPKILPTERTARVRFRAQAPSGHGYGAAAQYLLLAMSLRTPPTTQLPSSTSLRAALFDIILFFRVFVSANIAHRQPACLWRAHVL